jgi:opacity protein-like surface antigen
VIKSIFKGLHRAKTILYVSIILTITVSSTFAQFKRQQFEIAPFIGYLFTGNLQTLDGELKIDNSFNYGMALDIRISDDLLIELLYNRTDTGVGLRKEYYNTTDYLFDMSVEYFQAGVQVETETGQFRPFAAFTIGATDFNPKESNYENDWKFSFTAGGGIKYYFTDNLGVRLQWRFLVPIYFSSASIFCNDGYCGIFITGGTYLLQYDLTAGLIVSF